MPHKLKQGHYQHICVCVSLHICVYYSLNTKYIRTRSLLASKSLDLHLSLPSLPEFQLLSHPMLSHIWECPQLRKVISCLSSSRLLLLITGRLYLVSSYRGVCFISVCSTFNSVVIKYPDSKERSGLL